MVLVELAIPARSAYLSLVRLVVDASVLALGPRLGGARLDDLKVAVTEACSNAIDAHRAVWGDGPVRIRCDLRPEAASVEIVDQGAGFDPDHLATLPAATDPRRLRHESGLGIPLMRTLADDVTFSPVPGGTLVRITVQTDAARRASKDAASAPRAEPPDQGERAPAGRGARKRRGQEPPAPDPLDGVASRAGEAADAREPSPWNAADVTRGA
ncbi:MAG TPA: ATP-binding protein [Acidimicrobiales bacterium]|nr:ATP-binding protein [Acidimicrobiales bacterium]